MSYIKTFMEDYFYQEKEIYKPITIKYIIHKHINFVLLIFHH